MERFLAKTTYRAILKHAVAIDKDAALRAVLVAFPCSFYDPNRQQWTAVDVRQEWLASRRAVDDFVRELNGSSDWYLPHRSASTKAIPAGEGSSSPDGKLVAGEEAAAANTTKGGKKKKGSKKAAAAAALAASRDAAAAAASPTNKFLYGEATSHVRRLYRTSPLTTQNLNNAFATVKMLSYVMQVQHQLPQGELVLPDTRNLGGFEILKDGISPISHPHLMGGGEIGSGAHGGGYRRSRESATTASALAAARKIAQQQQQQTATTETTAPTATEEGIGAQSSTPSPSAAPQPPTPEQFGLQLIVSHPLMSGFFRHSIIMLSQAGDDGALGFIINKPVINDDGQLMPVWSFIPDVVHPIFTKYLKNNAVFIGGPVASPASRNHALFIIHRIAGLPGSIALGDGVFTTSDFNAIYQLFEDGNAKPEDVMVLLGYCGWGDGQLENEERKGSWVVLKRPWDVRDSSAPTPIARHTTTADYVFARNVVVDPTTNTPRESAEPLVTIPFSSEQQSKGTTAAKKSASSKKSASQPADAASSSSSIHEERSRSDVCSAFGEPRLSWVSLFGSLGPKYRAMARLADVRVDPYDTDMYEGGSPDE